MYLSVHFATPESSERYTSTGPLAVAFAGVEALVVTQVCTRTSAAHWYTVYYERSVAYRLHTANTFFPRLSVVARLVVAQLSLGISLTGGGQFVLGVVDSGRNNHCKTERFGR